MQISKRLMNGMVLMYHGAELSNFANQDSDCKNTLGLKYWFCMNGRNGLTNMINKFPRCESTAGNEDGHDDDQLIAHTHSTTGSDGVNHSHSLAAVGNHSHSSLSKGVTLSTGNRGATSYGGLRGNLTTDIDEAPGHSHSVDSYEGNHSHTLETTGGSTTGKNMPKYSGLQFIKRKR